VSIAAGELHSLALKNNGTVVAWGDNTYGQTNVPAGLTNVAAIAVRLVSQSGRQEQRHGRRVGRQHLRQTNVPTGLTNMTAIAGGSAHSLSPKSGGAMTAWGNNYFGQTNFPPGLSNVLAIAGGGYHSLAVATLTIPPLLSTQFHRTCG